MFKLTFTLTPAITKALMEIEACYQAITRLPLSVPMLESLRKTARLLSTHFSTQIEGNKLSASQVEEVIAGGGRFPGRERDEAEVRNYFDSAPSCISEQRGPPRGQGSTVRGPLKSIETTLFKRRGAQGSRSPRERGGQTQILLST